LFLEQGCKAISCKGINSIQPAGPATDKNPRNSGNAMTQHPTNGPFGTMRIGWVLSVHLAQS